MFQNQQAAPFREFGAMLDCIRHTIPVRGKILHDGELARLAYMSTSTYAKVKEARV